MDRILPFNVRLCRRATTVGYDQIVVQDARGGDRSILDGRAIIITAAGTGLGRAFAIEAARCGASIVINDTDESSARSVVNQIYDEGGQVVFSSHAVADRDQARALVALCVREFGKVDGLINNADLFQAGLPWDLKEHRSERLIEVNVNGVINCGLTVLRQMQAQGNGGVIVNITSDVQAGVPAMSVYAATKGAVASITYCWALDAAAVNVRVVGLSPEGRPRSDADRPVPDPSLVAPAMAYLLSDASAHLSGHVLRFDGKELAIMRPPAAVASLARRECWSVSEISAAVQSNLASQIGPVGLAAADLTNLVAASR